MLCCCEGLLKGQTLSKEGWSKIMQYARLLTFTSPSNPANTSKDGTPCRTATTESASLAGALFVCLWMARYPDEVENLLCEAKC